MTAQAMSTSAMSTPTHSWRDDLDERDRRLIANCEAYAQGDPAGMPGHSLALIIAQLARLLDELEQRPR
jgi:hypothetical protein